MTNSGETDGEQEQWYKILGGQTMPRGKKRMTIIAALRDEGSYLVASDSGAYVTPGPGMTEYGIKLQRHKTLPIVWGLAGLKSLQGERLEESLKSASWPEAELDTWLYEVGEQVSEINGRTQTLMKTARAEGQNVEAIPDGLFSLLVVGFVGKRQFACEITSDGIPCPFTRFHAIGTGGQWASIADAALLMADVDMSPLERLRLLVAGAVKHDPFCDPPIHIWRVTPSGIHEAVDR